MTSAFGILALYFVFAFVFGWLSYKYEPNSIGWYVALLVLSLFPIFKIPLFTAFPFVIGAVKGTVSFSLSFSTLVMFGYLMFGKREHRIAVMFTLFAFFTFAALLFFLTLFFI